MGNITEYHTSLDKLGNVVTPEGLEGGYNAIKNAIELIERNKKYKLKFLGEPQMSKRDLIPHNFNKKIDKQIKLMMDFISVCDGKTSILEIANKLNVPAWDLYNLTEMLNYKNLMRKILNSYVESYTLSHFKF